MKKSKAAIEMFSFKTSLFYHKHAISKKTGLVALYIRVYISSPGQYEEEYYSLSLKWPHDKVDREGSTVLPRFKGDQDAIDYNMIIMQYRSKMNDVAVMYRLAGRFLNAETLQRELLFKDSNKSLYAYFEKRRNELYNKREISLQTFKNYGTTANRIFEYQPDVSFDQINAKWMQGFKNHLHNSGNSHNTVWTRIKDLKAILRIANEEVTIKIDQGAIDFYNNYAETPVTFLNRIELKKMLALLKQGFLKPEDESVLKAFLFSCFTSLRISDIYQANRGWMLSDNFLLFTMQKNKMRKPKTIKIPIAPIAKQFMSDTLNKFFQLPTMQEYNRTLKELAIFAGVQKRLTSHVGRHTFGYLFMTSVGDIYALKEIMGHSKIATTERYAHLDEEYKLELVEKLQQGFSF